MKFELTVSKLGQPAGNSWIERYDREAINTEAEATAWAEATIAEFNATLRPHEHARQLHGVVMTGESVKEHDFRKTNLTTLGDHRGMYDIVKCEHCGCVARRYGLTTIKRQKPFTSAKWNVCPRLKD